MRYLIGIDDTDNLQSRGTGHRARMLGLGLQEVSLCRLRNITRHQLFVSPLIPYTSHNSSASLVVDQVADPAELITYCREFLLRESADGSDAGLCVAPDEIVNESVIDWGNRAKYVVLTMDDAYALAAKNHIYLEGLTGEKCGIIGSLAAVGLRKEGNDGRLLWLPELRETTGIFKIADLYKKLEIDAIVDMDGQDTDPEALVEITNWSRPVMRGNKITLVLQKNRPDEIAMVGGMPAVNNDNLNHGVPDSYRDQVTLKNKLLTDENPIYSSAPKEYIKSISG